MKISAFAVGLLLFALPTLAGESPAPQNPAQQAPAMTPVQQSPAISPVQQAPLTNPVQHNPALQEGSLPRILIIRTKQEGEGEHRREIEAQAIPVQQFRKIVQSPEVAQEAIRSSGSEPPIVINPSQSAPIPEPLERIAASAEEGVGSPDESDVRRGWRWGWGGRHGRYLFGYGPWGYYGGRWGRSWYYPTYGYYWNAYYYPYTYSYYYPYGGYNYYYYYNPYYPW